MSFATSEDSTILIVDDNPTNLGILFDFLNNYGFKVLVARDGESAIQKVEYALPDLILLDVMMPGIDGFETCRRLKANQLSKDIPVIFMTALTDTENKVTGLNLGAVDYITKPIQHEEVLARVRVHLNLQSLTKKLQSQNLQLQQEIKERTTAEAALQDLTSELESRVKSRTLELFQSNELLRAEIQERKQAEIGLLASEAQLRSQTHQLQKTLHNLHKTQSQLIQTEKISSLGQLVAGIAHEVNNPVSFISGNIHHANQYVQDLINFVNLYQQHFPNPPQEIQEEAEAIELEYLIEDLPKILKSMQLGTDRIREIMLSLRNFSRTDEAKVQSVNLHDGIDSTLTILQYRLKAKPERPGIQVIKEYGDLPLVECYGGQLNQVFMNLLANAIDALDECNSDSNRTYAEIERHPNIIRIRTELLEENQIAIHIADNGLGMTEEVRSRLFEPFFTTKPMSKGTGMGLSISYQIVTENHGGEFQCISSPGQGTEFVIQIPTKQEEAHVSICDRSVEIALAAMMK